MKKKEIIEARKGILKNLKKSFNLIDSNYESIKKSIGNGKESINASEWLLDNKYLIDKECKAIRKNMPYSYFIYLPVLNGDRGEIVPRIFKMAKEVINKDIKISESSLIRFIEGKNTKLKIGELWAFSTMLKIAVIQDIASGTEKLKKVYEEKRDGNNLAYRLIKENNGKKSSTLLEELDKSTNKKTKEDTVFFLDELKRVLLDNSYNDKEILKKIEIIKDRLDINEGDITFYESNLEDTIGGGIDSLRKIDSLDWVEFFENTSITEKLLREDPIKNYQNMDFESKEYYRHSIEKLSRTYRISEEDIVEVALDLAKFESENGVKNYKSHIGYYLIDDGIQALLGKFHRKEEVKFLESPKNYILANFLGTFCILAIIFFLNSLNSFYIHPIAYLFIIIALIVPASEIVISLINRHVISNYPIKRVPRLDLKGTHGIGRENKTIVIVPTLIENEKKIDRLIEKLKISALGNADKNIHFAILGDFKDNKNKILEKDEILNKLCNEKIKELNKEFNEKDKFFILNRGRVYSKSERKFIPRERKRGKIVEFIALLKGEDSHTFNFISSSIDILKSAKYIITIDTDTLLKRGSAIKLIGSMAHILNKPIFHKEKVKRGYTIIQPKISISLESSKKTKFSKIFAGYEGVDGYSTAYSDVYQDLFKEGSFTGKGILNIDGFYNSIKGKIKDERVLSHDLLEGALGRCALSSDIEFIDDYPSTYEASSKRLHRWVRGDWQLAGWLFSNKISALSKWKILDNLRRSLLAPSILLSMWLTLIYLNNGRGSTILIALSIMVPFLFTITDFVVTPKTKLSGTIKSGMQIIYIISFIPYQTAIMLSAIIKSIFRMNISKRKLLEWETAEALEKRVAKREVSDYILMMWQGPVLGSITLILSVLSNEIIGIIAIIASILWFISPILAYDISKKTEKTYEKLSLEDREYLKVITRRIWAYYEDFNNEDNNYLAPDNYQEHPFKGVAKRTSPTNIGMGLMANLSAYHMGYITLGELVDRSELTVNNIEELEKWNGHLLNWYNTETKRALTPKYISTVDSGNLLGYLLVLKEALKEYKSSSLIRTCEVESLLETYKIIGIRKSRFTIDIKDSIQYKSYLEEELLRLENLNLDKENKIYWIEKAKGEIKRKIAYNEYFFEGVEKFIKEREIPSLNELENTLENILNSSGEDFKILVNERIKSITSFKERVDTLIFRLDSIIKNMNFKPLYDNKKGVFTIGYNLDMEEVSTSYYDILSSESRLTSFLAISRNEVDDRHWFKLCRAMKGGERPLLMSWSGTMFEYLMPSLVMRNYEDTILDITYKNVIKEQINYGRKKKIPWGISESAFYEFDIDENYQYKAFGIPEAGAKRGLDAELVVSPYSTLMALQFFKKESIRNLKRLEKYGAIGRYGFIESIDYTPNRVNANLNEEILEVENKKSKIRSFGKPVRCYMVHHLGMSIMALDNVLNSNKIIDLFHNIPEVKSAEILLKEKIPPKPLERTDINHLKEDRKVFYEREEEFNKRNIYDLDKPYPEINLIGNGNYSIMTRSNGSCFSKFKDTMLYRYNMETTYDESGMFFYIKDLDSKKYHSPTYEPCKTRGDKYIAEFTVDKTRFIKEEDNIESILEIFVAPEDSVEIRSLKLKNIGNEKRRISIITYMEATLTSVRSDLAHKAFSNLFIETEFSKETNTLLAKRRGRTPKEEAKYLFITGKMETLDREIEFTYETRREEFIGRNNTLRKPDSLQNENLKNGEGIVLDPVLSLETKIELEKGEEKTLNFIIGYTKSKEDALKLAKRFKDSENIKSAYRMYKKGIEIGLRALSITSKQANLYSEIGSYLLFNHLGRIDRERYIREIEFSQENLWAYGISGDLKIIMVKLDNLEDISALRNVIKMHYYIGLKGIESDLIIYNNEDVSYENPLNQKILETLRSIRKDNPINKKGGVFLHNKSTMPDSIKNFIIGISAIYVDCSRGSIKEQFENRKIEIETLKRRDDLKAMKRVHEENDEIKLTNLKVKKLKDSKEIENKINLKTYQKAEFSDEIIQNINLETIDSQNYKAKKDEYKNKLDFFNGYGGFKREDCSYHILLGDREKTPAPWINVMSNEVFGTHISETGASYTWCENSRENKITPWNNDSVKDSTGEAIYIRDEDTGGFFTITKAPLQREGIYEIEHGFGYSKFTHTEEGIESTLEVFIPQDERLKIQKITLRNNSNKEKNLSIFYYLELILGVNILDNSKITTYINNEENFSYAKNPYSKDFKDLIAYSTILGGDEIYFTCDKNEAIGMNGSLHKPRLLKYSKLQGSCGSIYDPCLASQSKFKLMKDETRTFTVLLGEEKNIGIIKDKIEKYKHIENTEGELRKTKEFWREFLGGIQVHTGEGDFDYLLNGWLLYQNYSCRYLSRTAFYQSGGAYGFRDQLQDSLSLGILDSTILKKQILKNASRQYKEGDVQHWWHPIVNSGIRTRFSDDLLWMPYAVCEYINLTDDYSILDEKVEFLDDAPLNEGEDERYTIVNRKTNKFSLYEHCIRAINKGLNFGTHGIPLMGSGDWNDGMSTVGNKGKGESVWLGWFLIKILRDFSKVSNHKGDEKNKNKFLEIEKRIEKSIEENAWDGNWYKRAYFDDGTPLGSKENEECKIDSLAQSFSIISRETIEERSKIAMDSLEKHLIDEKLNLIKLLTPPFEKSTLEPGYIKGYVAGVRENGGQYTHAATWVILALAKLGEHNKAFQYYKMINPINHTDTKGKAKTYKGEPYVMAADVYTRDPHGGRAGWTWYTGAAGWMYKVGLENLIGLKKKKNEYEINPCMPEHILTYTIKIKNEKEDYNIQVIKTADDGKSKQIIINGKEESSIKRNQGKLDIKVYYQ